MTLTGPGGREDAVAVASPPTLDAFDDGVCFVPLAAVADPALVASAVAQALGVEAGGGRAAGGAWDYLRARRLLLVLDNFEQVLDAAPDVVELLRCCPRLHVLVTKEWGLRAVFATSGAADRFARATLRRGRSGGRRGGGCDRCGGPGGAGRGAARLPESGGAPVVARYGQADPAGGGPDRAAPGLLALFARAEGVRRLTLGDDWGDAPHAPSAPRPRRPRRPSATWRRQARPVRAR